jgi:hypothetical protein
MDTEVRSGSGHGWTSRGRTRVESPDGHEAVAVLSAPKCPHNGSAGDKGRVRRRYNVQEAETVAVQLTY